MEPFFSIVIPVYNREKYINRCIDSILNQTFDDWEAIFIDDGSTDNSAEIIRSYNDSRIKYFFKENGGASSARNVGIDQASGSYIAFLDSDDEFLEDHLLIIYDYLKTSDYPVCLVCTDFMHNIDGNIVYGDNSEFINRKPNFTHLPYLPTTAIHRDAVGNDRFNENIRIRTDNEFLDRIRTKVPSYRIKERTVIIYRHDNNTNANPYFAKKETEKVIYYYIKTRKKFSKFEWLRLYESYSYLTLYHFRKKNTLLFIQYFMKMIVASPICLIHYKSLKTTLTRIKLIWSKK